MGSYAAYDDHGGLWRIGWHDEDGLGAVLGEDPDDGRGKPPVEREAWEHWTANKVALDSRGVTRDSGGFYWESVREAAAVVRQIKVAIKAERPLPEWANEALKAGWKPPRGWKP